MWPVVVGVVLSGVVGQDRGPGKGDRVDVATPGE